MFNKILIKIIIISFITLFAQYGYTKRISSEEHATKKGDIAASLKDKKNDELLTLINSGDPHVAGVAADILGKRKDISVVPVLLKLLKEEDRITRSAASIALGNIGSKKAVKPLMDLIKGSKVKAEKISPLIALCKIGDPTTFDFVESEASHFLNQSRIYDSSVGKLQDVYIEMRTNRLNVEQKLKVLIEMLKGEKTSKIAGDELIKLGEIAIPEIINVLKDKKNHFSSRYQAIWCLARIKDKRRVDPLIGILLDDTETDRLRYRAAYVLGISKDKKAIPALKQTIEKWKPSSDTGIYNVSEAARKALKEIEKQ